MLCDEFLKELLSNGDDVLVQIFGVWHPPSFHVCVLQEVDRAQAAYDHFCGVCVLLARPYAPFCGGQEVDLDLACAYFCGDVSDGGAVHSVAYSFFCVNLLASVLLL